MGNTEHDCSVELLNGSGAEGQHRTFLDSGAFSAWTRGIELDLEEYAAFIHEHCEPVTLISVLDDISDPKVTLENQRALESLGVDAVPCFHFGEPEEYLARYVDNYDYISFGGMVGRQPKELVPWLDRMFREYICDANGIPRVRVHGFGMTRPEIIAAYPWRSVDSISWTQASMTRAGLLFISEGGTLTFLSASEREGVSPSRHINSLPARERESIHKMLIEKYRVPNGIDDLGEWQVRAYVAAVTYHELGKGKVKPFTTYQRSIFDKPPRGGREPERFWSDVDVYLAGIIGGTWIDTYLRTYPGTNRLASYFEILKPNAAREKFFGWLPHTTKEIENDEFYL